MTSSRYETDFYAWTQDQVALLRAGRLQELDLENLADEIASLGRQEHQELTNRLRILIAHLLKWQYQGDCRCVSWEATITVQREDIQDLLAANPSLKSSLEEVFAKGYQKGRLLAIAATNLNPETFPKDPPFDLDFALNRVIEVHPS